MSRADGVLRVVLTGKWFDMVESGEKMEEYRGAHWAEKLVSGRFKNGTTLPWSVTIPTLKPSDFHPYHTLVASRGYTSRTLTRKIKRIRWGTPRPEWSDDTVTGDCFVIELGAP